MAATTTPDLSYIIPVSNNGKPDFRHRVANLQFIIDKFLRVQENLEYEVIFVEQVTNPKLPTYQQSVSLPAKGFRWVHISYPEYNKCWSINVGARMSFATVIAIAEADVFSPSERYLNEILMWFRAKAKPWAFGWDRLKYLNQAETKAILRQNTVQLPTTVGGIVMPKRSGPEGGVLIYDREWYLKIGGHNEWMQGLGGPDNEMADRAKWWSKTYHKIPLLIYHLWHPVVKPVLGATGGHRAYNRQIVRFQRNAMETMAPKLAKQPHGNVLYPLCSKKTYVQMRST